ncbi:MAG TPA: tRNA lysidine(34) synthetase TilS [Allosphingosinicella sp.]|jgi:tRNA(Ile)-lysidine synthase
MDISPDLVARFRSDMEALTGAAPRRLGVAVSGGPDSLALLLLAHAAFPGAVKAATVDHRLRSEAAEEARFVAGLCAELGVPHRVLEVDVAPRSSLQRAAREARYAALGRWAEASAIPWLATAHHLDDQAETLLMRLVRGAGVAGLAGIRPSGPVPGRGAGAKLVRPLLSWRRAELAAVVHAAGIAAIQDPSNSDARFDRVRIRERLSTADWIDPNAVARSAGALAEAEEALEWAAGSLYEVRAERAGGLMLDMRDVPAELVRRMVLQALREIAPGAAPRGEEVQRLIAELRAGRVAMLAGVRCSAQAEGWRFEPAPPRRPVKA